MEFPFKEERSALGGRTSYGLGPIRRVVLSGPSDGRASCFIKSRCWQGKLSACCVGRGPIAPWAIPSQYFELKSNQERTGLFFS